MRLSLRLGSMGRCALTIIIHVIILIVPVSRNEFLNGIKKKLNEKLCLFFGVVR